MPTTVPSVPVSPVPTLTTDHQTRAGIGAVTSAKRLARLAGVLYLLVAIFGGFAFGFVSLKVYVPGDAATTAGNVIANSGLLRVSVVADLFQATASVVVGMTLYRLLKHVNRGAASAMVIFIAIATSIMCLNSVFAFASLRVATDGSYAAALGTKGSDAIVLLLVDIHYYGYLIAQIFFGLWLLPMGYLAYKSRMFPRALGVALIVGGLCYLVDMLALFLVPHFGAKINSFIAIPPTVAEVWMVGYLLVFGARNQIPEESLGASRPDRSL